MSGHLIPIVIRLLPFLLGHSFQPIPTLEWGPEPLLPWPLEISSLTVPREFLAHMCDQNSQKAPPHARLSCYLVSLRFGSPFTKVHVRKSPLMALLFATCPFIPRHVMPLGFPEATYPIIIS